MNTVEAVDRRLATWSEWLQRVDDSLLALEGEPTYQMLAGLDGKRAPLEGVTAERVSPALDALADLFDQRQRLGDVFARVKEIRASMSSLAFWENDAKLKEIRELLDGPSIKMMPLNKPLAQRGLLDRAAEEMAVSPEQLLGAMVRAFEVARDAVLAVQRAWATLEPALERMEREVADLRAMAERVGEVQTVAGELGAIARALEDARARIARDPLGTTGSVEGALAPRIAEVRARLSKLSVERDRVAAALAIAADKRRALGETHQRARSARQAALAEYAGAKLAEPISDDLLDGLDTWREKLEATANARRWSSAAVGVQRWIETCDSYIGADRAVLAAAEALASKQTELAGRLSARVAQLRALIARGASPNPQTDALLRQAESTLRVRPLPLEAAEVALDAFEQAVVELSRRKA